MWHINLNISELMNYYSFYWFLLFLNIGSRHLIMLLFFALGILKISLTNTSLAIISLLFISFLHCLMSSI